MAIDYVIDYNCVPKETLGTEGIIERLKAEDRARAVIALFRQNGDDRPPSEMGFEFTRRSPEGEEETRVIVVQDLLDDAAVLRPLEDHCIGCPANRTGLPFGCMGFIQYPLSEQAENWLLDQLPVPDEPLVWLLLRQVIKEFDYKGDDIAPWRQQEGVFFETTSVNGRKLGELTIDSNQVFELLFARRQYIIPRQAALLLLFFNAIHRDLEADVIRELDPAPEDVEQRYPFILTDNVDDDSSITEIKAFLRALYIAWKLNVNLLLDI